MYVTNGATGVTVGGSQNEGNVIGSTQDAGIRVNDLGTSVEVSFNTVGQNLAGDVRESGPPIFLNDGASDILVDNNIVANAPFNGIRVRDVSNVTITNNEIVESSDGIEVDAGSSNIVIGTPGNGNIIYNTDLAGIRISDSDDIRIEENIIGRDPHCLLYTSPSPRDS